MAFVSPEFVAQQQLQHQCVHWRVTDKSKKLVINRNESNNLNASIDQLQETLANCQGDYVCVTLYTIKPEQLEAGSKRGQTFDLLVKLKDDFSYQPKAISGVPSFADMMQLHQKIQQYEIEKIKAELQAEQKETAIEKLIGSVQEHIPTLISLAMAKINKTETKISGPEKPINQTLSKLATIDADYQNTLSKMAEYLEKNPAVLPQIKAIIGA